MTSSTETRDWLLIWLSHTLCSHSSFILLLFYFFDLLIRMQVHALPSYTYTSTETHTHKRRETSTWYISSCMARRVARLPLCWWSVCLADFSLSGLKKRGSLEALKGHSEKNLGRHEGEKSCCVSAFLHASLKPCSRRFLNLSVPSLFISYDQYPHLQKTPIPPVTWWFLSLQTRKQRFPTCTCVPFTHEWPYLHVPESPRAQQKK